jgi:hypothetical protein
MPTVAANSVTSFVLYAGDVVNITGYGSINITPVGGASYTSTVAGKANIGPFQVNTTFILAFRTTGTYDYNKAGDVVDSPGSYYITAAEIASPTTQILSDVAGTFIQDVSPYIRRYSNGTALQALPAWSDSTGTALVKPDGTTASISGFVNVKKFGAVGDFVTDDTAAIQAAINNSPSLFFPPGRYLVSSTLTMPTSPPNCGGVWQGAGSLKEDPRLTTRSDDYAAIYWNGAVSGTLLECDGQLSLEFRQLNFVGQKTNGGSLQAGKLIHFKQSGSYGSGESTFHQCTFTDAAAAIQCGVNSGDGTCAGISFDDVFFESCTRGLYVVNNQGVNYYFNNLSANFVVNVIDCEAGGRIGINGGNFVTCGGTGATDYPIRLQTGSTSIFANSIRNLSIEQNTKRFLQVTGPCSVVISGLTEAQTDQDLQMFDIKGAIVTIEHSSLRTNATATPTISIQNHPGGGQRAALVMRSCEFDVASWVPTDWINLVDINDMSQITIEHCKYDTNQLAVPYLNNRLELGPVIFKANTTDATATVARFMGSVTGDPWPHNTCNITTNTAWLVDVHCMGYQSGGSVIFSGQRRVTIKNISDVLSLVGAEQTIGTDENAGAYGGFA